MRKTPQQRRQERFSHYRKSRRTPTQRHWDHRHERVQHIRALAQTLQTNLNLPDVLPGQLGCETHCLLRLPLATLRDLEHQLIQMQQKRDQEQLHNYDQQGRPQSVLEELLR